MAKISKIDSMEPDKNAPSPAAQKTDSQEGCEGAKDLTKILEGRAEEAQKRATDLLKENSELKDQYLRKLADYENFRKRMFREKEDAIQFANTSLLQDLLGILDDFDRAIQSSEVSRDFQVLHDGIGMVRTRMLSTLEGKYGLARYESAGEKFDPNIHEAVAMEQGSVEEPEVAEEFLKGYKLNGRVLRAAKVKVKMPGNDAKNSQPKAPMGESAQKSDLTEE